MKVSSLLIQIEDLSPTKVTYTSKSDIDQRIFAHFRPQDSKFPYDSMLRNGEYGLISVQLHDGVWRWYKAWELTTNEVLIDSTLNIGI
jgi:hypothetical protein